MKTLKAYPDSKSAWGYAIICDDCAKGYMPRHIDITKPIYQTKSATPGDRCDFCNKKGKVE